MRLYLLFLGLWLAAGYSFVPMTLFSGWNRSPFRRIVLAERIAGEETIEIDADSACTRDIGTYEDYLGRFESLAKSSSYDETAIDQAYALFDEMVEAHVLVGEERSLWPRTDVMNFLIETHVYSWNGVQGMRAAEDLVRKMSDDSNPHVARPDAVSYGNLMEGYARQRQPELAHDVLDRALATLYVKDETYLYNKLVQAYSMTGNMDAAAAVFECIPTPNHGSFLQLLRGYAKQGNKRQVLNVLQKMTTAYKDGNEDCQPDVRAWNELLRVESLSRQVKADVVERILNGMLEQARKGLHETMMPNDESFYHAILGYKNAPKADKVEDLLQQQKKIDCTPSWRTLNAAMQVLSLTNSDDKAPRVRACLTLMKELEYPVPLISYKNMLRACAYNFRRDTDRKKALELANETFNEVRRREDLTLDAGFYVLFLRCCANLMDASTKRDDIMLAVVKRCCRDGMLSGDALKEFEVAASPTTVDALFGDDERQEILIEWTRNIKVPERKSQKGFREDPPR